MSLCEMCIYNRGRESLWNKIMKFVGVAEKAKRYEFERVCSCMEEDRVVVRDNSDTVIYCGAYEKRHF